MNLVVFVDSNVFSCSIETQEFSRLDPILLELSRSSFPSVARQQGGTNLCANNGDANGGRNAQLANGNPSNASDPTNGAESKVGDGDDEDLGGSREAGVEMHPCVSCERLTKYKCNSCMKVSRDWPVVKVVVM